MFFENIDSLEGVMHIDDEEVVDFLLSGLDVIGLSPETCCDGVAAGGVESFSCARSGRLGRVTSVRVDLCFCCHVMFSLSESRLRFRPQGSARMGNGLAGVVILKEIEVKIDVNGLWRARRLPQQGDENGGSEILEEPPTSETGYGLALRSRL